MARSPILKAFGQDPPDDEQEQEVDPYAPMSPEDFKKKYQGRTVQQATPDTESWSREEALKMWPDLKLAVTTPTPKGEEQDTRPFAAQSLTGAAKQVWNDVFSLGGMVRQALPEPFKPRDPGADIARAGRTKDFQMPAPFTLYDRQSLPKAMGWLPKGPGEELGAEVAKVGEMTILPSGRATRLGRAGAVEEAGQGVRAAIGAAARYGGLPQVYDATQKYKRAFELFPKAAAEGTWTGVMSEIQGDDPGTAATAGAAGRLIGEPLVQGGKKLAPILREKAIRDYGRMFKPQTEGQTARARQGAEFLLDQEKGFYTRGHLARYANKQIGKLGEEKARIENALGGRENIWLDADRIIADIDDLGKKLRTTPNPVTGRSTFRDTRVTEDAFNELENIKKQIIDNTDLQSGGRNFLPYITGEEFKEEYQIFLDKLGRFDTHDAKDMKTMAAARATDMAHIAMLKAFDRIPDPNPAKLNATLSFWLTVRNGILGVEERSFGRQPHKIGGVIMPGTQGNMAERISKSGKMSLTIGMLNSVLNSPAWLSVTGKTKNFLARRLAEGKMDDAVAVLTRIMAEGASDPYNKNYPNAKLPPPGRYQWTPSGYVPANANEPISTIDLGDDQAAINRIAPTKGDHFVGSDGTLYVKDEKGNWKAQ